MDPLRTVLLTLIAVFGFCHRAGAGPVEDIALACGKGEYQAAADVAVDEMNKAIEAKDMESARRWARKRDDIRLLQFPGRLTTGSVQQRIEFLKNQGCFYPLAKTEDTGRLADALVRYKALVFDISLREKQAAAALPGTAAAVMPSLYEELRNAEFGGAPAAEVEGILTKIRSAQTELSSRVAARDLIVAPLSTTAKAVSDALPPDTALIEYFFFTPPGTTSGGHYGAVVFQCGHHPRFASVFEAKNLEDWMWSFQMRLRKGSGEEIEDRCRRLYEYLFLHCEKKFEPGIRRVIISPGSLTGLVSFASLIAPSGEFLCTKYEIRYVASGRLLLRPPVSLPASAVIIGDPDFTGTGSGGAATGTNSPPLRSAPRELTAAMRSVNREAWLSPLPDSGKEAGELDQLMRSWGWSTRVLTGTAPTEKALRSLTSPGILHLATHGFWLNMEEHADTLGLFKNPMYRSGVTLAGAGPTVQAWANGRQPHPGSDGMLLADEVSSLNLEKTWLVVLSACDTGVGYFLGCEGSFGLPRAFLQAGAGNVLSTLWPIPDKESAAFMPAFYQLLKDTRDPAAALSRIQRERMNELRRTEGIAAAVLAYGGFVLQTATGFQENAATKRKPNQ